MSTHRLTPIRGSLINSLMIWYSHPRAIEKAVIGTNYPRLTLPREHANATTKAYAKPRDWLVQMGEDGSVSYKPNSTASVDSQGDGVWVSLCALRVGAALDRSRYNKSERAKSFLQYKSVAFANGKRWKIQKKVKKGIDKPATKWYNNKAVGESVKFKSSGWKNLKKVFKTPLTNRQQSDIINKLSTERLQRIAHWKLNNNKMY